ncbi:hypothetical protein ABAC460_00195 [Asticcacaulis sp. AC460]|nr:hypothetical protein ABAC460_00195 [Asticcacaulis sp. AC460]
MKIYQTILILNTGLCFLLFLGYAIICLAMWAQVQHNLQYIWKSAIVVVVSPALQLYLLKKSKFGEFQFMFCIAAFLVSAVMLLSITHPY